MTRRSAVSQSPPGYHPEILVNMIGEDREISDAEWQAEIDRIRESERIEYGMALASGKVDNCDVVRRKIRALIDNGEMKVGEFQKELGLTTAAYSRFMSQHGPDKGSGSSVYDAASDFFMAREAQGIQTRHKSKPAKAAASKDAVGKGGVPDVDDILLEGELDDEVPVYDTCDDVRRKINAHLKRPGVTQAAFLRGASASFHTRPKKLFTQSLSRFRSKKGPYEGNTMDLFYGAYVYLEKLRIKEKKPKSKKRLEMEIEHAPDGYNLRGGVETQHSLTRGMIPLSKEALMDPYARMHVLTARAAGFI